jgi:hypothetical protein
LKYKIKCNSILLQKALENFLEEYLDENGLVISDVKGDIIIGKDIIYPFTKKQLLLQLKHLNKPKTKSFDEKLDELIEDFSNKLKKLIKEEYGKK